MKHGTPQHRTLQHNRTKHSAPYNPLPLQDMQDATARALALIGLQSVEPMGANARMSFRIHKEPAQRVFALASVSKDTMIIAPLTPLIASKSQPSSIEIAVAKTKVHALPNMTEGCVGEFWAIRRSSDKAQCNCEMTNRKTSVTGLGGKPMSVNIPCIKNIKAIAKGEEVVLHVPAEASRKAADSRVSLQVEGPSAKRQKV